jgi:predicted phage terminase large subunit-like protein
MEEIRPQKGPQEKFMSTSADIALYGGAAGGGKSFASILEPLRHVNNKKFGAVIFRRTLPQVTSEGGLWDEAENIYTPLRAEPKQTPRLEWKFPSGSRVTFAHLQHEKNLKDWQGSQIPLIIFDELCHFTEKQFWYMFSRNRSMCGIKPYIRATCNPDPDSFVCKLIEWWIDQDTGYAIKERSGVIRYFLRISGEIIWGKNEDECFKNAKIDKVKNSKLPVHKRKTPKSFTFIASNLEDNKILMENDPGYAANLDAMPLVDRERLKKGNWKIKPASGLYFKRRYFEIVENGKPPVSKARGWDLAATPKEENEKADFTAGVPIYKGDDGYFYITGLIHEQMSPAKVDESIVNCASSDGLDCVVRLPQDPGQAGKAQMVYYAKLLPRHILRHRSMRGDKVTRAGGFSSACENGLVKLVKGPWNDKFLDHAEAFPPKSGSPDIIDAAVEAYHELTSEVGFFNTDI